MALDTEPSFIARARANHGNARRAHRMKESLRERTICMGLYSPKKCGCIIDSLWGSQAREGDGLALGVCIQCGGLAAVVEGPSGVVVGPCVMDRNKVARVYAGEGAHAGDNVAGYAAGASNVIREQRIGVTARYHCALYTFSQW
jgi:hypothetical protein